MFNNKKYHFVTTENKTTNQETKFYKELKERKNGNK